MHLGSYGKMLGIYNNRKVYVTGHTGFKGSWMSCVLNTLGAKQAGYSLGPNTNPSHFEILNLVKENSTIGDLSDFQLLKKSIYSFQPEILFHLAAQPLVRESYKNPLNTYQTNVIGTLNVLEAIRECPSIKAIVIITTDKVYKNREWLYPYREEDELGGYDIYSSSKACAEILVKSYQQSFYNLNDYKKNHRVLIATARAGNVIGGGDWSADRLIPDLVKSASSQQVTNIRNPAAVRPWQHVLDCIHGYLMLGAELLLEKKEFACPWNFAPYSFESKTVKEVAEIAKSVWGNIEIASPVIQGNLHEANLLKLDNSKALSELNWKPRWNTEAAIEKTIEWYKEYYINRNIITYKQIENFYL
jgi:CDP-glucose 4,6-dehydratase